MNEKDKLVTKTEIPIQTPENTEGDVFWELFKNIVQNENVKNDDFFPNEIIQRVKSPLSYNKYFRYPSTEELQVLTSEAFFLLLFWVKSGDITLDFFERFLSILITYQPKIKQPISDEAITSMVEMISLVEFKEHVIYTTIELYLESPSSLKCNDLSVH